MLVGLGGLAQDLGDLGLEQAAAWSPDGRRVVFTSARSGVDQIFVMDADGLEQRQLSRGNYRNEATSWQ